MLNIKRVELGELDSFWDLMMEQVNYDKKLHPELEYKITKEMIRQEIGSWNDPKKYFDGYIALCHRKSNGKSLINGSEVIESTAINQRLQES